MHAGHELTVAAQRTQNLAPHPRHGAHADRHVGAVSDLDSDMRDRTAERPHRERNDVHRAPAHAALEQRVQRYAHAHGVLPIVGRARVLFSCRANEGAALDAGDVGRIRPGEIGIFSLVRIEPHQHSACDHFGAQAIVFLLRAVSPVNALRLSQRRHLRNPSLQALMLQRGGRANGCRCEFRHTRHRPELRRRAALRFSSSGTQGLPVRSSI